MAENAYFPPLLLKTSHKFYLNHADALLSRVNNSDFTNIYLKDCSRIGKVKAILMSDICVERKL